MARRPALIDTLMDRLLLPGLVNFTRLGYAWRAADFAPLEPLDGRHVVITGATSGIGLAASRRLASLGARLTVVGRNRERLAALVSELDTLSPAPCRAETADLSLLVEVRDLVRRLHARDEPIHVLINNAGALFNEYGETGEGFERTFALNLLSPFLLTQLLMPRLSCSAPARVITVSSGGMYLAPLDVAALAGGREDYRGTWRYALAKRAQVVLGHLWAEEFAGAGIDVFTMHPGWADTPGVQTALPAFRRLTRPVLRTPDQGADTLVFLAAARDLEGQGDGGFWLDRTLHTQHVVPWTHEKAAQREALWQLLLRSTRYGDTPATGGRVTADESA